MTYTIKGIISDNQGTGLPSLRVEVYALQPGSETLLEQGLSDENGAYSLNPETASDSQHLQLRVRDFRGEALGASDIRYNAQPQESIDLKVKAPALLSEFEYLTGALEQILPKGTASLREQDIPLLLHMNGASDRGIPNTYEKVLDKSCLECLLYSQALALKSGLPAVFFYGMSRQLNKKPPLSEYLEMPESRLLSVLQKAAKSKQIPTLDDSALGRLQELAIEQGLLVRRECFGYLRQQGIGTPLEGFTIQAHDLESGSPLKALGSDVSNRQGLFYVAFHDRSSELGKQAGKKNTAHRLRLHISSPESREMHQLDVAVKEGQKELGDIMVHMTATERAVVAPKLTLPPLPSYMFRNPIVQHKINQANGALTVSGENVIARAIAFAPDTTQSREDATSPVAYLADLLDYAELHLFRATAANELLPVKLIDLRNYFHQPFNDLLVWTNVGKTQIRQIRLCIEVLRAYLGVRPLSDAGRESALAIAEAQYLETTYRGLLLQLGVSYEELSQIGNADASTRQSLANRLSISVGRLDEFWKAAETLNEAWLKEKFGWFATSGDTLETTPATPTFLAACFEVIQARWQSLPNKDTPDGLRFLAEQQQIAVNLLSEAVGKTEEVALPLLRDALIAATGRQPRWLSEFLLLDCEYDAGFMTTRVWQAIVTIQQLLWSIRTGLLRDTRPELRLKADDFTEEWNWLGTYETWRAAMLVFLYPENLLDPTLRKEQTPVFEDLVHRLRGNRRLTPANAGNAVGEYEQYFKDICQLEVEATCQTKTLVDESGSIFRDLFYQFGRHEGRIYWSDYNPFESGRGKQSTWQRILGFENFNVNELVGAVPYLTSENKRYIFLFAKGYPKGQLTSSDPNSASMGMETLCFTKFDLQSQQWSGEIVNLGNPNFPDALDVVVEQRLGDFDAPHFISRKRTNEIYQRSFNKQGTGWEEGKNWELIQAAPGIQELHALMRIGIHYYLFFNRIVVLDSGTTESLRMLTFTQPNFSTLVRTSYLSQLGRPKFSRAVIHSSTIFYFLSFGTTLNYRSIQVTDNNEVTIGNVQAAPVGMSRISVHNGMSTESVNPSSIPASLPEKGFRLAFDKKVSGQTWFYQAFFKPNASNQLEMFLKSQTLPGNVKWFKLKPDKKVINHQMRQQQIETSFSNNSSAPPFVLNYLWEAYYFLPIYVAIQLQRSREFESKDYFRMVYDYSEPVENRKIFYGLKQEETLGNAYDRPEGWLLDPLNPHSIAAGRINAYTRYTLQTLIRCLLQEADVEFTRGTVESLAIAQSLYATAEELLNAPESQAEPDEGENLPFDIIRNPVLNTLRLHAEINLYKLHTGRNIVGDERPKTGVETPTPFRYAALIERAKQLTGLAQQMEAAFLSALEKLEVEQLNLLNAKNDLQLSKATVRLQDLRVKEAVIGVRLAGLQQNRALIQRDHFQNLLVTGLLESEKKALELMDETNVWQVIGTIAGAIAGAAAAIGTGGAAAAFIVPALAAGAGAGILDTATTNAEYYTTHASYERRQQDWVLQRNLANQDIRIGNQQIRIAQDQVQIANQERNIASLRADHSETMANFLANKFLNVELYDWMSDVLEGVYSFFLQQATATAQLAARQLAFERQEPVPSVILADYWQPSENGKSSNGTPTDRRGLTGSARLLQDLYQLDQIAFQTDRRKLQLMKTISLAQLSPTEFQRFRESGVMLLNTSMEMFDRDFPGHYLRMIKRVRTTVVALVPPIEGIHATISSNGISRIVLTNGAGFTETTIRRPPESIALSASLNATGLFEMQAEDQAKLYPFESMGVDTFWEFELPKASNFFDFSTIADVLLTIEYTALASTDYRRQVIQRLDRRFSGDRAFSFRQEFADQWYDLHHPELNATPMRVSFDTRRTDFPPNLEGLKIQQVVLYFSRKKGMGEIPVQHLKFTPEGNNAVLGLDNQNLTTIDGVLSTRSGNVSAWNDFISRNLVPFGTWELLLPDSEVLKTQFKNEQIEDILFVITFEGLTPEWPN